jgi:shikimate kinase
VSKKGIVLIGMAGVGKSTVGRALAKKLGWDFVDIDVCVIEETGKTLQQIIDEFGEMALLELESKTIMKTELSGRVISPGGSIIYRAAVMDYLNKSAHLILLDDNFKNIKKRLGNAVSRGIIGLKSRTLREIYLERRPIYARYADFTVDVTGKTEQEIVGEISRVLRNKCSGGI